MKIIIAKTYEQYVRCCHQNCLKVGVVPFIQTIAQIEKLSGSLEPIYHGDFWNNPAYPLIERVLKSRGIKVSGKRIRVD